LVILLGTIGALGGEQLRPGHPPAGVGDLGADLVVLLLEVVQVDQRAVGVEGRGRDVLEVREGVLAVLVGQPRVEPEQEVLDRG
jgi:hypothetical protein